MPGTASPDRRAVLAGPAVAVVTLLAALVATQVAGVPLVDPGDVSRQRLVTAAALVAAMVGVDVIVRRHRWTPTHLGAVSLALLSFFVTYFAYRNLKSVVPLLRPGDSFDVQLMELDRDLLGGHAPAAVLQDVLGTGAAAHALSTVYMGFFAFIPVVLALTLVFLRDRRAALFFTTALALNWALGAASYFILPSIGPFYAEAGLFTDLPSTTVTHLQGVLLAERTAFLADPSGAAQSIGAFASLHVSIVTTAAMAAHVLRLPRGLRVAAWVLTALTVIATLYFGWHYIVDDVAGVVIAVAALTLARLLTGHAADPRRRPHPMAASAPERA
jgi:hypothetical protein